MIVIVSQNCFDSFENHGNSYNHKSNRHNNKSNTRYLPFCFLCLNLFKHKTSNKHKEKINMPHRNLPYVFLSLSSLYMSYAMTTVQDDAIMVTKKYKITKHGYTHWMIVDDNAQHYKVHNSVWHWKWNSVDDWHQIKENKVLFIRYYGWRIPMIELFPTIIVSEQATFLDSMTCSQFLVFETEKINTLKQKPIL